jgi:hypothetical protein
MSVSSVEFSARESAILKQNERTIKEKLERICLAPLLATVGSICWLIANRGGFAYLSGMALVPSQHMCPNAEVSRKVIDSVSESDQFTIEKIEIPDQFIGSQQTLKGVIYYPKGWNKEDKSRCILYHNPNGAVIANYFDKDLEWTPGELVKLAKCPIIMYDYQGTGLSSESTMLCGLKFKPTHHTIIRDGGSALNYALEKFQNVTIVGSSLGGSVATISLDNHFRFMKICPLSSLNARGRVQLINHDSFTNTSSIVAPKHPKIASWIVWAAGAHIDVTDSMKRLIARGIPITVLCHRNDPVVPAGARMAEMVESLSPAPNVTVINSPFRGHANLSSDMLQNLKASLDLTHSFRA